MQARRYQYSEGHLDVANSLLDVWLLLRSYSGAPFHFFFV